MDALGINLGFFIAQIVNFGIIFLLLSRGVWPRVIDMLDERAKKIEQGLEKEKEAQDTLAKAEREREEELRQARVEGQKVIEEARQRGDEQVQQALGEAKSEAEQIRTQARAQAEDERNRILGEARGDIVSLAIAAAEQLIGKSLGDKQQQAIIKDFFAAVPADAKNLGAEVTVISAVPLADDELAEVKKVTGAETVENKVDPSILGGLILHAGDKVVDGSVREDVAALAHQLQ